MFSVSTLLLFLPTTIFLLCHLTKGESIKREEQQGSLPFPSKDLTAMCKLAQAIPNLQALGWKTCNNIGTNPHLTEFQGLTTYINAAGTEYGFFVDVSGQDYTGYLPTELGQWQDLVSFKFGVNELTGTIPDMSGLTKIRLFDVSNNTLSGTIPLSFGALKTLTSLDLSWNGFTGAVPSSFSSSSLSLVELTLSGNSLGGVLPTQIGSMPKISVLDFSSNTISGTIPPEFEGCTLLNILLLSSNQLGGTLPTQLGSLYLLAKLDLGNNIFTGTIPTTLGDIPLNYLDLSYNSLSGTIPTIFAQVNFNYLFLEQNQLNGPSLPKLRPTVIQVNLAQANVNSWTGCPPTNPPKIYPSSSCVLGGCYYPGCDASSYTWCDISCTTTNCAVGSGYWGSGCAPCNCGGGTCSDGPHGNGTCDFNNPCSPNPCEGICNQVGITSYTCSCAPPGILNITDQKTCVCPAQYYKSGGGCLGCVAIPGCISTSCTSATDSKCSTCFSGYYLTSSSTCAACTSINGCTSSVTCTSNIDSQCETCLSGYYLTSNGTASICQACTPVSGCTSTISCSSSSDSQCTHCLDGYYLDSSGSASICSACNPIPGCTFTNCTSAINAQCSSCFKGYYLDGNTCHACATINGCTSTVTCTGSSDSQCSSCLGGYYLSPSGSATLCKSCTAVSGCTSPISCTNSTSSKCTTCISGYYLSSDASGASLCSVCSPIPGCVTFTCTTASNSVCSKCFNGYYLAANGTCVACTSINACTSTLTCTTSINSNCSTCLTGYYLSSDGTASVCNSCSPVSGCSSAITCTSSSDSKCTSCLSDYYLINGASSSCQQCSPIEACTSTVRCTSSSNSVCTSCLPGYFLDLSGPASVCQACSPVSGCTSAITCSNSRDSRCTSCLPDYYLSSSGNSTVCLGCPRLPGCDSFTCTNEGDSRCTSCFLGYYLAADGSCNACTTVNGCISPLECSSSLDSKCVTCLAGYYLTTNGTASACNACTTSIQNCATLVTCTNSTNAQCYICTSGFYRRVGGVDQSDSCVVCPSVYGCTSSLTCSSPSNSQCTNCLTGYYMDNSASASACRACTPVAGCTSAIECTSATDSQCSECLSGFYLSSKPGGASTCNECSVIQGCISALHCTTNTNSICSACLNGFYLATNDTQGTSCIACASIISNCASAVTCTGPTDAICTGCAKGYYLKQESGQPDQCLACANIDNCFSSISCTNASDSTCEACSLGYSLVSTSGRDTCVLNTHCLFENWGAWSHCLTCSGAQHARFRNLSADNKALPAYCSAQLSDSASCGFPCVAHDINSKDAILSHLLSSYKDFNWLQEEFIDLANITVTKDADSIHIFVRPFTRKRQVPDDSDDDDDDDPTTSKSCENGTDAKLVSATAMKTATDTLPDVDPSRFIGPTMAAGTNPGECVVTIGVTSLDGAGEGNNLLGPIIGAVCGALIITLAIAFLVYHRYRSYKWVRLLPSKLQYHFTAYREESGWVKEGSVYYKHIKPQTKDWTRFEEVWTRVHSKGVVIANVYACCNPSLASNFATYREILRHRMVDSPTLFCKKDWTKKAENRVLRAYTHEKYLDLAPRYPWNEEDDPVPIIAAIHGTDLAVAKAIADKGFCALASLDAGFFGKGIYFTTFCSYAVPYFITKKTPTILVTLGVFGNAYPVIENSNSQHSHIGQPIMSGYQSHFVITEETGQPVTSPQAGAEYNELVVGQEAQVVAMYIVTISSDAEAKRRMLDLMRSRSSAHLRADVTTSSAHKTEDSPTLLPKKPLHNLFGKGAEQKRTSTDSDDGTETLTRGSGRKLFSKGPTKLLKSDNSYGGKYYERV